MPMVEKDYEELLQLFNKNGVRYFIIGAYAVAFYAIPRYTKDIDILIDINPKNVENILKALREFGFGNIGLASEDFTEERQIIQLGYEPVRIDILTSLKGLDFEKAWKNRKMGLYGKEKVYFIGLEDLIKIKEKARRKQDVADIETLKKARKRKAR